MIKGLDKLSPEYIGYIGAQIAELSHDEQVAFFKGFIKECNSWGTAYQRDMQLCRINDGLTDQEKEQLSMITFRE